MTRRIRTDDCLRLADINPSIRPITTCLRGLDDRGQTGRQIKPTVKQEEDKFTRHA